MAKEAYSPFTAEQVAELAQPLEKSRIAKRAGAGGLQLSYIKGWNAIDTANQIFGFGNWGHQTLSNELVAVADSDGKIVGSYYAARVRLEVQGCVAIIEEGCCAVPEGRTARAIIDGHDMARKGAITDALKRALRCYGDQFGNSLYDKDGGAAREEKKEEERANDKAAPTPPAPAAKAQPAPIRPPARTCPKCDSPAKTIQVEGVAGWQCEAGKSCGYRWRDRDAVKQAS